MFLQCLGAVLRQVGYDSWVYHLKCVYWVMHIAAHACVRAWVWVAWQLVRCKLHTWLAARPSFGISALDRILWIASLPSS